MLDRVIGCILCLNRCHGHLVYPASQLTPRLKCCISQQQQWYAVFYETQTTNTSTIQKNLLMYGVRGTRHNEKQQYIEFVANENKKITLRTNMHSCAGAYRYSIKSQCASHPHVCSTAVRERGDVKQMPHTTTKTCPKCSVTRLAPYKSPVR